MTTDQARQVAERIGNAKNELLAALRIAERSSSPKIADQIGALCGRVEALQGKAAALAAKEPKKLTMRQFARQAA